MNQIAPMYIAPGHEHTPEINQMVKEEALEVQTFMELATQQAEKDRMKVEPGLIDNACECEKGEKW